MSMLVRLIISIFFVSIVSSCATIISGSNQNIYINSYPQRARVYDNGKVIGETPLYAPLKRRDNHQIRIELETYNPYEIKLKKKFNPVTCGNIIVGVIGICVDAATGSITKLDPEIINAQLTPTVIVNKTDYFSLKNAIDINSIFDVSKIDSLPTFIGDKDQLFNLFQKAEGDNFFIDVIINADGTIDESTFYTDDKYISKLKSKFLNQLLFKPGQVMSNDTLYNVKTRISLAFNQTQSNKISGTNAEIDIEKSTKNGGSYIIKKYPAGYNESVIKEAIDYETLLNSENTGIYVFNLSKSNVTGTIKIKNTPNNLYQKEDQIIRYKYKKYYSEY